MKLARALRLIADEVERFDLSLHPSMVEVFFAGLVRLQRASSVTDAMSAFALWRSANL